MNPERKSTLIAGWLYIASIIVGLLSVVPVIDLPDYLSQIPANEAQIILGASFQFLMVIAYVGYALALYPILRRHNESLALGFVGSRLVGAVFIILAVILLLLFIPLGQEFAKGSTGAQMLGEIMRTGRDLVNHVGMILVLSLGSLLYYFLLFQTRLVPRWLSGWGLAGAALAILASLLLMFRLIGLLTPVYLGLNIPLAVQEIVLAIWLIVRGFNRIE